MNAKQTFQQITRRLSIIPLLLFAVLLAGCATSRDYPGPVHGQTFNGTIKSIDLKEHRLTVVPLKAGEPVAFVWDDSTKFWKKAFPSRPTCSNRLGRCAFIITRPPVKPQPIMFTWS